MAALDQPGPSPPCVSQFFQPQQDTLTLLVGSGRGLRVGTGVVDPDGRPPAAIWSLTVNLFKSKRFRDVSLGLISGQPVCSADAGVQISFDAVSGTRMN